MLIDTGDDMSSIDREEIQSEPAELHLNVEVLERRNTKSYIPLNDLYQMNVFTDEFREAMEHFKEESQMKNVLLQKQIFMGMQSENEDIHEQLVSKMFTESRVLIPKENETGSKNKNSPLIFMTVCVAFLLFLLVMLQYYSRKRKESLKHVNDIDFDLK